MDSPQILLGSIVHISFTKISVILSSLFIFLIISQNHIRWSNSSIRNEEIKIKYFAFTSAHW